MTSLNHNQSANHGEERQPTDERYDRAHEFIEVCRKLWDSWEPDAVVMDREAGVFADPAKVHRIEHVGRFFKSRGPLNVVRSPQNGPAILQAGTSPKGRTFAARYADAIFAIQPNIAGAKAYYEDIKRGDRRARGARRRRAGSCSASSRSSAGPQSEAREKQAMHNALVPLEGGLAILSGHLDFDLSQLGARRADGAPHRAAAPADADPVPHVDRRAAHAAGGGAAPRTERGAAADGRHAGEVADQMEDYFDQVGGDGFMLSPIYTPGAIEEFVDLVVPELQRRGRYRQDYAGTTQRDHLMQER